MSNRLAYKMKSEVHRGHQHHRQHRHRHCQHSKHKRRDASPPETCSGDMSPVPPVPSDTPGSERYFPLSKDRCDNSGTESPENTNTLKRRDGYTDDITCEKITIISSDSDDNAGQDEEQVKRRKKHRHKEKKKRKHHSMRQRQDDEEKRDTSHSIKVQENQYQEPDCEHNSPVEQDQMLVRVKQEPQNSDEETRRRHRADSHRQKMHAQDRNTHSSNHVARDGYSPKPDHPIKDEPRDRSTSCERKPPQGLHRRHNAESRNGTRNNFRDRRDRRNWRANGESSSAVRDERDNHSQTRVRNRRHGSDDPEDRIRTRRNDSRQAPPPIKRERASDDEREYEWGQQSSGPQDASNGTGAAGPPADRQKPNFGLSGKLTEDTNVFNGVIIKYSEPPEARKPKRRWRFYPFKGDQTLPTLYLHRQSAFLIGRDRKVADIPVDHPSCSKQHAALQYRLVPFTRDDGMRGKRVRPYIIDLESANGTFVNNKRIEARKFVELMERDVVKFGYSSRDYVLLHEQSKDDEEDDDQNE